MPENSILKFANAVKEKRKLKNISQQKLHEITGISLRHIANIENGVANPSFEIVAILSNFLDISLDPILQPSDFNKDEKVIRDVALKISKLNTEQRNLLLGVINFMIDHMSTDSEISNE